METLAADSLRSAWESVYARTSYVVQLPAGELPIRIGQTCPVLDAFLRARAVRTWAFVSACNPRSHALCEQENLARHENLLRAAAALGLTCCNGEGRSDAADGPAERGLLITGITEVLALELGLEFEQNAIVFGERDGVARLLWCDEEYRDKSCE